MTRQSEGADLSEAVRSLPAGRWLLAVSGGRDSMALLHALASLRPGEIAAVATFDHATGAAARHAVALVEREGSRLGLPVVTGRMTPTGPPTEANWRDARWRFLRGWSRELDADIVTAHTLDDQMETVAQRILRGSGPRGLAGMSKQNARESRIVRPLLGVSRAAVVSYTDAFQVPFVEDPSNLSRVHGRNRMRHDLLPALEAAAPGFRAWLADLAARAGRWRAGVESFIDRLVDQGDLALDDRVAVLRAATFDDLEAREWGIIWPAVAARLGLAMDRRGVMRASAWAPVSTTGSQIPLSGNARIERTRDTFVLRIDGPGTS